MTPEQCRAGRAMLGWTQADLAYHSGLTQPTIRAYEKGGTTTRKATAKALEHAMERAGALFEGREGRLWVGVVVKPSVQATKKQNTAGKTKLLLTSEAT